MTTLEEIADAVHQNAIDHGFHPTDQTVEQWLPDQLLNTIGEISEIQEARRSGKLHSMCDKFEEMVKLGLPPLTCAEEEYADLLIRCLDHMRRLKINITKAVLTKHAYNKTRPFKHGRTM